MKDEVRIRVDGETERVLDRIIDAIEPRLQKIEKLDDFESSLSKLEPLKEITEDNSNSLKKLQESTEKRLESLLDNLTKQKQALDAVVEGLDGTKNSQAILVSLLKSELEGIRADLESQKSQNDILSSLATLIGEVAEKTSGIEGLGMSMNEKLSSVATQMQHRLDYLSQPWWRRLLKKGKA